MTRESLPGLRREVSDAVDWIATRRGSPEQTPEQSLSKPAAIAVELRVTARLVSHHPDPMGSLNNPPSPLAREELVWGTAQTKSRNLVALYDTRGTGGS
jgi:hypothetical protein